MHCKGRFDVMLCYEAIRLKLSNILKLSIERTLHYDVFKERAVFKGKTLYYLY